MWVGGKMWGGGGEREREIFNFLVLGFNNFPKSLGVKMQNVINRVNFQTPIKVEFPVVG